jgi:ribosomal protein S18 acetylase RimI-like enzyme
LAEVRGFRAGDEARLAEIANEAFGDEVRRGMPSFDGGYFVKRGSRPPLWPGVRLTVAAVGGAPVGFALLTDATVEAPAQLHLVAVDAGFRGRGLGRMLVGDAVEYVGGCGAGKLKLSVRPWNSAMRGLCSALGFTEEATLRLEYLGEDLVQYAYFY